MKFLKMIAVYLILLAAIIPGTFSTACSAESDISFISEITPCAGSDNGKIQLNITSGTEKDIFSYSIDGGKNFVEMKKRSALIRNISEGSYSLVVKDRKGNLSDTSSVYVTDSKKQYMLMISAEASPETVYKDGSIKIHIKNYDREKVYEVSVDCGKTWTETLNPSVLFVKMSAGRYTVFAREQKSHKTSPAVIVDVLAPTHKSSGYVEAECIMQNPELPTGCEITSLTMLLNHIGFKVSKTTMAETYLKKGANFTADPYEVFVGSPDSEHSYGCFSKPIADAAESYLSQNDKNKIWQVRNITGCSFDSALAAIDRGDPVVIWTSMYMSEIGQGSVWTADTGRKIVWPANEHCMLLTGYDMKKKIVYVNDPLVGKTSYEMAVFRERFETLGKNAIIITKKQT